MIEAMGPMATVVLEETLRSLGLGSRSFPEKKLETLVRLVSEEVLDPSMREKFKQTVMPQIQRDRRKGIL